MADDGFERNRQEESDLLTRSAHLATLAVAGLVLSAVAPAHLALAEVRFGNNVRIGGHDVSNQTFNKQRRGRYYLYDKTPKNPGCRWIAHTDGSRTKVCHLKTRR